MDSSKYTAAVTEESAQKNKNNVQIPPTKRQRLSLSQSKESISEGRSQATPDDSGNDNINSNWSHCSVFSAASNSLISENSLHDLQEESKDRTSRMHRGETQGSKLNAQMIRQFDQAIELKEKVPQDYSLFIQRKVVTFIENNPLN